MENAFTTVEGTTNVITSPVFYKTGFTLAEVLITLGIIGVVAAMTIPTLISNMASQRYRTQLKKTVSTLSQAARLNKARYDWDYADVSEPCGDTDFRKHTSETHTSVCALLNSNLSSILGFERMDTLTKLYNYQFNGTTVGISKGAGQYTVYSLADGTFVGFRSVSFSSGCTIPIGKKLSTEGAMAKCTGFIDVNGASLPNEETKCSVGTTSINPESDCIVKNKDMKDVFPIIFHDSIVEGATNATRYVLQTTK
ncbi:MAG: type II secretion system GspH family protein [Candidatus Gastranaerophilales bacterium]|nr:type II secretion system GspH family protein [Candidatus Gastranaerophilales bacterium]